jgi:hypothetical protein
MQSAVEEAEKLETEPKERTMTVLTFWHWSFSIKF